MIHAAIGSVGLSTRFSAQHAAPALTLFCDFDGPIVDVSDRYYYTYRIGLAEMQMEAARQGVHLPLTCLKKAQFWQMKQERTPDPEIAMRSGLQADQIPQFLDRVREIVNRADLLDRDQLQPGVRWALALLHSQGVRLVLVTLRQEAQARQILRQYRLDGLFSGVWGTRDADAAYLNQADQKAALLEQAMTHAFREGVTPAWMIGDTEADILAGQSVEMPTIGLTCGIRSAAYLQKFQPCRICADLASAAHYLSSLLAVAS
ncbi:MAG: HAD hydrolase-like protein [Elainella sp. Prado103]|jgi:phosphoglycolate phosphatase-like HAD superfamily hydrolase|nr:HAD hydrolase-like protein [Elainella sp. Prado103]